MPELPEVETIRQDLSKLVVGKTITGVERDSPKQLKPSLAAVKKAVIGAKIKKIERRAKLLIFQLQTPSSKLPTFLLVHLKLTGRLLLRNKDDPADDWVRVVIGLSGGKELRFCDLRKFGWMKIMSNVKCQMSNELRKLGPEPFSEEFTIDYLGKIFAKTAKPVKLVLMDQEKIAGIGNIYANEALFLAGIDPQKQAKKLRYEDMKILRYSILKVLKAGIKYRGASDQYYLDALGRKGKYQEHFLVYGRAGKKCFECGGKIERIKLGGRGTFYCSRCQV